MATGRSTGGVRNFKPVPSWLNSPAWSNSPSSVALKKSNVHGVVENGNKELERSKVHVDSASDRAGVGAAVVSNEEEVEPVRKGHVSVGNRNGSLDQSTIVQQQKLQPSDALSASFFASLSSNAFSSSSASSSSESFDHNSRESSTLNTRVEQFIAELSRKRIHLAELQRMAAQGIPDEGGIRSITWKLLLGYVPRDREEWTSELAKKRAEYASFREELLVTPSELTRRKEAYESQLASNDSDDRGFLPRHDITNEDHPLSVGASSVWHKFFQDTELSEQIDRDVKRTHPDIQFFCGDSAYAYENREALKRALFIFAKLNPGIRYVQGMNEVFAPLYYVFRTDPDEAYSVHAEADAFFCFVELLSDFRDNFCQQLDNSAVGVRATLSHLNALLKKSDEELWRHLEFTAKVNPQFYAFRWITLLLTQEFDFLDCLRLWDSFLSNPDGPLEILLRVCCAMLVCVRSRLLAGDFTTNLKLLQNYPSINIHHLLGVADELKGKS